MKRALRGPFFLRNIENKLLVDHIKSTNSLFKLRGCFVTAPFYMYYLIYILSIRYLSTRKTHDKPYQMHNVPLYKTGHRTQRHLHALH